MAVITRLRRPEEIAFDSALDTIAHRSQPAARSTRSNVLAMADAVAEEEERRRREEEARMALLSQMDRQQYNAEMERRQREAEAQAAAQEAARREQLRQEAEKRITRDTGRNVSDLELLQAQARNPALNNVASLDLQRAMVDITNRRKEKREARQAEWQRREEEKQSAGTVQLPGAAESFRRSEEARERGTGEKEKGTRLSGSLANEARNLEQERRNLDNFEAFTPGEEAMKRREYAELEKEENRLQDLLEREEREKQRMSVTDAMRALDVIDKGEERLTSKNTPDWMLENERAEMERERAEAEAALAKDPEAEKKYRVLRDLSVYKPVNVLGQDTDRYRNNLTTLRLMQAENPTQADFAAQAEAELTRRINLAEDPDTTIKENEARIRELEEMELSGGYFGTGTPREKIKAAKENLQRQNKFLEAYKDLQGVTEEEIAEGKKISEARGEKTEQQQGVDYGGDIFADAVMTVRDAMAETGGADTTKMYKTWLGQMNENERNLYYAYLAQDAKDGGNRAAEYKQLMDRELDKRRAEATEEYVEGWTTADPYTAKLAQAANEPLKLAGTVYDAASRLAGTNNPHSMAYLPTMLQDTVNETVSNLIDERVKDPTWNKVVHVLDEAGTNILNNGVRNAVGGALGLGPVASTVAMGLGEAGGTAREAALGMESSYLASLNPAEDSRQAALKGAFSAIGEMAGEFLPTEHWFGNIKESTRGIGQFIVNVLKQTATEIPGEILTDVIDKAADNYIMKERSEDAQLKAELVYNGIPEDEADRLVRREFGRGILNTVMVTALSSGASSAYTQGIGNSRVNKAQRILDDYTSSHGLERIQIEGLDDLNANGTRQTYEAALDAANHPDTAENSYSTPEAAEAAAAQPAAEGTNADEEEKIGRAISKAAALAQEKQLQDNLDAQAANEVRDNVNRLAEEIVSERVKPMTEEQIRERDREAERVRGRAYVEQMTPEEEAEWIRQRHQTSSVTADAVPPSPEGKAASSGRDAATFPMGEGIQAEEFAPAAQEAAGSEAVAEIVEDAAKGLEPQPAEAAQPVQPAQPNRRHIELKTKAGKEIAIDMDEEGSRSIKDESGEHVEFDAEEDQDSAPQVILRKTHGKDTGEAKAIAVAIESADENQDKDSVATEAGGAYTAANEGREISDTAKATIYSGLTEAQLAEAEAQGKREREERQRIEYETTKRNAGRYGFRLANDQYRVGLNVESLSDENAADGAKRLQMMALDAFGREFGIDIRVHNTLGEGKENGQYRQGSGVINVSLDAEDGGILRAASHELYHYIRDWAADGADRIKTFVLDTLANAQNYNLEQRRAELTAENERNGIEEDVDEEIVADSMLDVIGQEGTLRKALGGNNETLIDKIKEGIGKVRNFLRNVLNRIGRNNAEVAALKDDEAYMERLTEIVNAETRAATARRREKERARAITEKQRLGKYTQQDLIGIAKAVEEARETGEETAVDDVLTTYGAYLMQETDDAEEGRDKRRKVKRLFEALDEGQNIAKAAETAELELTDEQRTFFGWAERERHEEETVEREKNREKHLPVEFSRKEEETDPDGETAEEITERVLHEEEEEEEADETWKTKRLFGRIVDLMKYGRKYFNDPENPNVGTWADRVPEIVNEVKSRGYSSISDGELSGMIRKMYTALDDTIARGGNITPSEIFNYATEIAEQVAKKARRKDETAESEDKSEFRKFLHDTVFRINPELKGYIKSAYGGIWQLNKEFRGITSFTWAERGNTYDKDGHRKGTHPIDDLYVEGWRGKREGDTDFFDQNEIPNREDQFEHFIEMANWARKEETTYSWAGMRETDYIEDITNAIVMDYLDIGVDKMMAGTNEQDLDRYRKLSRELQKQYRTAKRTLEDNMRQELAEITGQDPSQIDLTKRGEIKEKYKAQLEALATQYAADAQTEAVNMQLEAARQMDEAAEATKEKGTLLAQISDLRAALAGEHEARELEYQHREEEVKNSLNEEIRKRAERAGLQRNIKRNITNMQRRLQQPSDKAHIADEYRGGIATALKTLGETIFEPKPDAKTGWTYAFSTLRDVLQRMEDEADEAGTGAINIDPDLAVDITNLEEALTYTTKDGEKKIRHNWRNMSNTELKDLDSIIERLRHTIDHADEAHKLAKDQTITDLAEELHGSAENAESEKVRGNLAAGINRYLNKSLRDPVRYFKEWSRKIGGESGQRVWKALRASLDTQIRDTKEAERLFAEATNNTEEARKDPAYNRNDWDIRRWTGKSAAALEVQLDSGETVTMTPGQLMYVYLARKREQARNHMLGIATKSGDRVGGGITIARAESKNGPHEVTEPVKVTDADLQRMEDLLTKEQKEVADRISAKILNGFGTKLGNEVSQSLYGYTKFTEKSYIPIKIYEGGKSVTSGTENMNPFYRLKNQGFTKQLVKNASAPLEIQDLFDIASDHTVGMINYHAWAETLSDITRLLNYKFSEDREIDNIDEDGQHYLTTVTETTGSVSQDIIRVMGRDGKAYLTQLLKDINGLTKDQIEAGASFAQQWLSKYKGAAVAFNLSTVAKQPLSIVRAFDVIPMHYFARGTNVLSEAERTRITEDMAEYAPIYTWKQYGNFIMDAGKSAENIFFPQMENAAGKISETGMKGAGLADNLTWMNIWRAAERMTDSQHPDLQKGSDEYKQQVAEIFNQCIDETQVVDSILHRTEIMRSKSAMLKMVTSFMGEPLKTFNAMMDKVNAYMENRTMDNARSLAKTAGIMTMSGMLVGLVSSIIQSMRHWDDDKPLGEEILKRYLGDYENKNWMESIVEALVGSNLGGELNPLNSIPYARDIMELMSGYDISRTDMDSISNLIDTGTKLVKNLSGEETKTPVQKRLLDFASAVSNFAGIPIGNLVKETRYLSNEAARGMEAAGVDTLNWQYFNLRQLEALDPGNKNDYIALMLKAEEQGNTDWAQHLRDDLIANGITDEQIDNRVKTVQMGRILGDGESVSADNAARNYYAALKDGDKGRAADVYSGMTRFYTDSAISSAIASQIKNDPRTEEVNKARMKGDSGPMQQWVKELRALGISDDLITKGINNSFNALTKAEKAETAVPAAAPTAKPEVTAEVGVYTYSDLYSAVGSGTAKDAAEVIQALRNQGKKDDNIRTQLTKNFKPDYLDAYRRGDKRTMQQLESKLLGLGVGYTEKSFATWIKDYEKNK